MPQSKKLLQGRFVRLVRRLPIKLICIIILGKLMYNVYFCPSKISYKVESPITTEAYIVKERQDFLINTPGCYIPNYAKTYKYESIKNKTNTNEMCGVRYIFVDPLGEDKIKFRMNKYTEEEVICCFRFARESPIPGHDHDYLSYSACEVFTNNTVKTLLQEVIAINCNYKNNTNDIFYKDTYIILKKINVSDKKSERKDKNMQWNVLMIGLDSMSRTRVFDTMPHTTKYLKNQKWLDFKAYLKVGSSTFQNLMSILTGKQMSTTYSNCTSDLDKCADFFIWKKYKYNGYKTAHGESNLLSETFLSAFKKSPTDHYMRPLLRTTTSSLNEIPCIGKKPSAMHLLEYADKFVDTYKTNTFFGMFWINTYTSDTDCSELSDTDIVNFFRKLNNYGVLNNTFVIFFSDQGASFTEMRHQIGSYYDYQLPMLFVRIPLEFRRYHPDKLYNLQVNQERLITTYDMYITLADILKLSINSSEAIRSEACPQCTSLFELVSPNRTCADAGAGGKWCSCHNMSDASIDDEKVNKSISSTVAHIQNIWKSVKTIPYTSCEILGDPTIFRANVYHEGKKTYHVIAFHMSELEFEAVVVHYGASVQVLYVRSLTRYNIRGNCALHSQDRPFCVCAFEFAAGDE